MNRIPKDKSLMKTISWKTKGGDYKFLKIIETKNKNYETNESSRLTIMKVRTFPMLRLVKKRFPKVESSLISFVLKLFFVSLVFLHLWALLLYVWNNSLGLKYSIFYDFSNQWVSSFYLFLFHWFSINSWTNLSRKVSPAPKSKELSRESFLICISSLISFDFIQLLEK